MSKNKLAISFLALLTSVTLLTAEENMDKEEYQTNDKCEAVYSQCMAVCESKEGEELETCYDKCDEQYSKCLEESQSN